MNYPKKFKELIECFESLPGIGAKTAERLAFYVIDKKNSEASLKMSRVINESIETISECPICGMLTDGSKCEICEDESRTNELMVVENSKNVLSFEKLSVFHGRYHILGGLISPTNGKGPDDINISKLIMRIEKENIKEVIIATGSNIDGELTALYIKKILEKHNVKTYRIGYGLPASTDIEYVDEVTLIKSLESKKEM